MNDTSKSGLLSPQAYDAAEAAAMDNFPIRVNQAFFPEMFATVGYPARVSRSDLLWRYIDVMHETRTQYNMDYLLFGLTDREFELFQEVTRIVDRHATQHFGRRAHATAALLRAIHVLRLIKVVTGDSRPAVLEVGPGCGYLAMLLVLEGYPYIGTDVAQAFYLYQSHMLSHVAKDLKELAVGDEDVLSLETPKPGTAVHIPWWKWFTFTPEKVKFSAGIMTSNHCLCEMHPNSMSYLANVSSHILGNHAGGGKFVFDSWGYDLLHGEDTILAKFASHGFRLVHNEVAVSAMALVDHVKGWPVYGAVSIPIVNTIIERKSLVDELNQRPWIKKPIKMVLDMMPGVKQRLINLSNGVPATSAPGTLATPTPISSRIPDFKADNPISKKLTDDRKAVIARAKVGLPEIRGFLNTYYNGKVPPHPDEVFFDLIGLKQ